MNILLIKDELAVNNGVRTHCPCDVHGWYVDYNLFWVVSVSCICHLMQLMCVAVSQSQGPLASSSPLPQHACTHMPS